MKKWYSIVLLIVFFLFSSIVSSSAEISSEELLQILKEKGIIIDKDIEKATTLNVPSLRKPLQVLNLLVDLQAILSAPINCTIPLIELMKSIQIYGKD